MRGDDRPHDLTPEELAIAGAPVEPQGAPTLEPAASDAGTTAVWQRNRRVVAVWSNELTRNAWLYASDIGWVRLAHPSDSALLALTILSGHARQTQSMIDYRTDTDGLVHELYIW
jgi:hypothetical protein